ncbi:MAG: C25 family cysteine peptidase [Chitinophagaceae bacterium]
MKKVLWLFMLMFLCNELIAQPLNNEWIDYSKTYYKFKVGATGLYRINQATLNSVGLGSIPAEQFQLWRNGVQVPLFTSIVTGTMSPSDFIEFWGIRNDGKLDKLLYKNPANQISDKLSLQTDTAAFFLTYNTNLSANLRYNNAINNVAGNTLPAEPYFIHNLRFNYRDRPNRGYALYVGEDVYSSAYDACEFLSTNDISLGSGAYKSALKNLYVAGSGPVAILNAAIAGNSSKSRSIKVNINNTNFITKFVSGFTASINTATVPLTTLNGTTDTASIEIVTTDAFDRVIASYLELQYPREFNFDGNSNFEFQLPASSKGYFLKIVNFNNNSIQPVLYDTTNLKYYTGDLSSSGFIQFALPPLSTNTNLVLLSRSVTNINIVGSLEIKNFVNFNVQANQGDYLIVSHKNLMSGANAVEQYRQYRSSSVGGSYNAKIYDIDELVDQFAFGIKKHPLAVRNFLRMATSSFATKPKSIFLIGKGVVYDQYRSLENTADIESQNLIPTFGWPAADAMMVSPSSTEPGPLVPFGRLSVIKQQEILDYLDKVKQFEQQSINTTQTIANKAWMKQLIHVAGGKDKSEDDGFKYTLGKYETTIRDTNYCGTVANFNKTSGSETSPVTQAEMQNIFAKGIGMVTYLGHSAASGLAYNLNEPNDYTNPGKFPVFFANGCTAGNTFDYDAIRTSNITNLSEKWVLAPNRGSVAFIAMTHFGLTGYLDFYATGYYNSLAKSDYNKTIGDNMMAGLNYLKASANDYFGNTHCEQTSLNGDPAIKVYAFEKPDFVVEDAQVSINPNFISVADNAFNVKAFLYNIGKGTGDSVRVVVKHQLPNGSVKELFNKNIVSVRYIDSVNLVIPIDPLTDKGNNSITVTIDSDNKYDELSETNNSITKNFVIFEDEIKPIYPYNYAIINKAQIKLIASTANPLSTLKQYVMELDTTILFNSTFKITKTVSSVGGVIDFDPGIIFVDSTVYYWRVANVPSVGSYRWNNSSFVYLQNAIKGGYNQSHFYQHTDNTLSNLVIDTNSREFAFPIINQTFTIRNGVWPYAGSDDDNYSIAINDALNPRTLGVCWRGSNITFTVYDPSTLKEMYNHSKTQPTGQFGSLDYTSGCTVGKEYDFAFNTTTIAGRKSAMDFMDNNIPDGSYVVVRSIILDDAAWPTPTYANDWKQDASLYAGTSLYHKLLNAGFADIDSFNRLRVFAFVYQKNNGTFTPSWQFTQGKNDKFIFKVNVKTKANEGYIVSPKFGPVQNWYNMLWAGNRNDLADMVGLKILGVKNDNTVDTLQTLTETQINNDISAIDAATYPFIKLYIKVKDTVNLTAYQLKYWRLLANPLPEGALAPNIKFTFKDTLDVGDYQNVAIAFKNISDMPYPDSLNVTIQITDNNNATQTIAVSKIKKLLAGDTATILANIPTTNLVGKNSLYVNVNPNNNPQEQTLFNNFAYKNFFVNGDVKNPLLDITFDGLHILNGDIVSSKPNIRVALKDESKYLALNDTSLVTVQLKMPNGDIRQYKYGTDTLRFNPANTVGGDNTATVDFNPTLLQDGTYELYVKAKDKSNNAAGPQQYRVLFTVNNKPMITNVFNYPNPFTTSTAFVFTLTGTQVPQNIKIQILTVTGKIVKEITKAELGNLHIGRNITDYKWDGTDTYGQALGNGVYLYRVITSQDGSALDKLQTKDLSGYDVDTDKYFKAGYGKMYLMR